MFQFLLIVTLASSVSISNELGRVMIHQSDSISLNLYDYFEGHDLEFVSNTSALQLPSPSTIVTGSFLPFPSESTPSPLPYTSYATWDVEIITYILDFFGNFIALYALDTGSGALSKEWSVNLGYPVQQVVILNLPKHNYAIAITNQDINRVFIAEITNVSCATPLQLEMWDLMYISQLRTCSVNNTSLVPFIGNLYQTGLLLVYDFQKFTQPVLNQSIIDVNTEGLGFQPVDVAITSIGGQFLTLLLLDSEFGLYFYNYEAFFQDDYRIRLTQYGCLNNLQVLSDMVYENLIASDIITVGTCSGFLVIGASKETRMFFVDGLNTQDEVFSTSAGIAIYDIYFSQLNDSSLLVAQDRTTSQDIIYHVELMNLESASLGIYGRWTVLEGINNFYYVRTFKDGVRVFEMNIVLPVLTVPMDDQGFCGEVTATDGNGYTVTSIIEVTEIQDIEDVSLLNGYRISQNNAEIEVSFQGFKRTVWCIISDFISGNYLEYYMQYQNSDLFQIEPYSFDKVFEDSEFEIDSKYTKVLVDPYYLYLIYDNGIDLLDPSSFILNQTLEIPGLKLVTNYFGFVFANFVNETGAYISIIEPGFNQTLNSSIHCEFLLVTGSWVICADSESIFIFIFNDTSISYQLQREFSKADLLGATILDMATDSTIDELTNYNTLYVLTSSGKVMAVPLEYISSEGILKPEGTLSVPGALRIKVSYTHIYVLTNYTIEVYSTNYYSFIRSVSNPRGFTEVILLNDFLYLTTEGSVQIVDGQQTLINSFYMSVNVSNCQVTDADFIQNIPFIVLLCPYTAENKTLKLIGSQCPKYSFTGPCPITLFFDIYIVDPVNLPGGIYSYNISFIGTNGAHSAELSATLQLIAYGQAVQIISPYNQSFNYSIDYDIGQSVSILHLFSGNNMNMSLEINGENITTANSQNNPVVLSPKLEVSGTQSFPSEVFSLTSVPSTPYLLLTTIKGEILVYKIPSNTSSFQLLSAIDLTEFLSNSSYCYSIQYISTVNTSALFASLCIYYLNFSQYWQGAEHIYQESPQSCVVIWEISLDTWEVLETTVVDTNVLPVFLQVITDTNTAFTIIIADNSMTGGSLQPYTNNNLLRMSVVWEHGIKVTEYEPIDFSSLGLVRFFATAIDGIYSGQPSQELYNSTLYLVLADYWYGVRMLVVVDGTSVLLDGIPNTDGDPAVSVSMMARSLCIVTLSAKLLVYHFGFDMMPYYYVTVFPYTSTNDTLTTLPSVILASDYYQVQYLAFPVSYYTGGNYYRIINTDTVHSSTLVQDVAFGDDQEFTGVSQAVFINESAIAMIVNRKDVVIYNIGNYLLDVPAMDEEAYEAMIEKWNTNMFAVRVRVLNDNNAIWSPVINLTITMPTEKDVQSPSGLYWWIWLIIAAFFIMIVATVKVVYKSIIGRARAREMTLIIN